MKKVKIFVCIILIMGLTTTVLAGSEFFGTIRQEKESEYVLNNYFFGTVEEFLEIYPKVTVSNKLQGYELEYLVVIENPLKGQKFHKEVVRNEKLEWEHDIFLIDYLQVSYQNDNSEIINIHYKEASKPFISQLKDYTLERIQIGDLGYNIYHEDNEIKFITFEKELWGNKYNVHVELLRINPDGSAINQFNGYKDKDELINFLQSLSLDNLVK